jgi:hypothetical protein
MMRDPLHELDHIDVPDLMPEVLRRGPKPAPPEPTRRRVVAIAAALLLAAAAMLLVARAFPRAHQQQRRPGPAPQPVQTVGQPGAPTQSLAQGLGLTRPENWFLIHLPGQAAGAWPVLQLTNYDPGLDTASLCPAAASLPPDGVLLYVQEDLTADGYPDWPVRPPHKTTAGACGEGLHVRWQMGQTSFQGLLAFGPDASDRDRARLIDAFSSLDLIDPDMLQFWHDFPHGSHVPLPPQFADQFMSARRVVYTSDATDPAWYRNWLLSGETLIREEPGGTSEITPPKPGRGIGGVTDSQRFSRPVHGDGVVVAEAARVVILARSGQEVECEVGPSLARFGSPIRPFSFSFEPPLTGHFVAYDSSGQVVGRARYNRWPG